MQKPGAGKGDMIVHVRVITPASCSKKGKKMLLRYQAEEDATARNTRWWKDSYKSWVRFLF